MANTAISNLTASAANLASTDLVPVVQTAGVGPVKMTGTQLASGVLYANAGPARVGASLGQSLVQLAVMTSSDTTLTLSTGTTTGFPSQGLLFIRNNTPANSEIVSYTGITSTTFTGVTRGLYGTTASSTGGVTNFALITSIVASTTSTVPDQTVLHWPYYNYVQTVFGRVNRTFALDAGASASAASIVSEAIGTTKIWFGGIQSNTIPSMEGSGSSAYINAGELVLRPANAATSVVLNNVSSGVLRLDNALLLNGILFANVPGTPVSGMLVKITDSSVTTGTVAGGGANTVLAVYRGSTTNWQVLFAL